MKKALLVYLLAALPVLIPASDHICSRHRLFSSLDTRTHVQDSLLLKYDVSHYGISLEVNDTSTFIRGYTEVSARALEPIRDLVLELSLRMQVDSVFLNGSKLTEFVHEADLLYMEAVIPQNDLFRVRVYYHGYGGRGGFFSGISNRRDAYSQKYVTYTLSEPFAAKDWFACKQVLSDKADSADIWLTVTEGLLAGSNGLLQTIEPVGDNQNRFHWKTRYPIAYYLLSLSVSEYQDYSFYTKPGISPDSILVQNYIYDVPGYPEQIKPDIDATADMLEFYSNVFSLYPFREEKYGHCMAPMGGGMEHQTMTTLSSFRFNLVAHELTHQWYGDYVTCSSWQDIWINEGFASYGEYLAQEALISREVADQWMLNAHEWAKSEPDGSVYIPLGDATDVFRIFSMALSYKKGASLLHMIRYELDNDSVFFESLSELSNRFADSVASGDDYRRVLEDVSGKDFDWFFEQWYYGQGYPQFGITWWMDEDSLFVRFTQRGTSAATPLFRTSMDLNLQFESGKDTTIRTWIEGNNIQKSFPVPEFVTWIIPDPENWLLATTEIIRQESSEGIFTVSPNPFSDELVIRFRNGEADREIKLTDMGGKTQEILKSSTSKLTLNTQDLRQGLYILQVMENNQSYTTRVVRQ